MFDIFALQSPFLFFALLVVVIVGIVTYMIEEKRRREYREKLSRSGIYDVDRMDGIEFEAYLEVLFQNLGINAKRTKASNDYGADLVLEGPERVVVQAKRYKNKVGLKAVQEISSARAFYHATEAWVVTNNYFTTPAYNLAQSTGVRLIDRDELVNLILSSQRGPRETRLNG